MKYKRKNKRNEIFFLKSHFNFMEIFVQVKQYLPEILCLLIGYENPNKRKIQ